MHVKFLSLLLTFLLSSAVLGQITNPDTTLFSISELQEDFNFWRERLVKKHPILYHYNTREEFDAYFDSVYREIDRPMTKGDFFKIIGPTTSFTKCGHNQVLSGSEINDYIMDHKRMIPLNIEWLNDAAYVTYNYTNNKALAPGTSIKAINGVPINEIRMKCMSLLPDDGYSRAYAKFWVNKQFYFYYHLLFGFTQEYSIQTSEKNVIVGGLSVDEMNEMEDIKPAISPERFEGVAFHTIDSLNAGVLRVGSFFNADFKKLHSARFKKVVDKNMENVLNSNCKYLIIDVRGNDGGQPYNPLYLLRYIMNESFVFKKELRTIKNKNETNYLKRSRKTIIPDSRVGTFKPFKSTFDGEVYLIVDGGATSAAGEFASVIRRYNRGKIVGTETGGNPIILTGFGLGSFKKLPNTKLSISVGTQTTFMNDHTLDSGYGLIPDEVIEPSISDYLNGIDPCTEYLLSEISQRFK